MELDVGSEAVVEFAVDEYVADYAVVALLQA